jgi:hypothetical protein
MTAVEVSNWAGGMNIVYYNRLMSNQVYVVSDKRVYGIAPGGECVSGYMSNVQPCWRCQGYIQRMF